MTGPCNVIVLQGGQSLEAEISRVSAAQVAAGLEAAGHRVTRLEVDREAPVRLAEARPDVVFPALHGPPGEDGTVQGLLDILQLPYVGGGVAASAAAMDKICAKALFRRAGLPVADDVVLFSGIAAEDAAARIIDALGDQVVIKPSGQGSAIGIARLPKATEITAAVADGLKLGSVIAEPFITGREITVGVLDLHGQAPHAFPVIEIRTAPGEWYDAVNRYQAGASEHVIPAPLLAAVNVELQRIAIAAHRALGLRDLSRADFIVSDDEGIHLLEVNSLPGMTPTSLYPDGARADGWKFPDLLDALIRSAVRRS
ncbi:MAG: D-alanine--D-alanine ligase [Gammaproteobacteria bacterium]|nr:D-alanine--D-alanine ligase [Gammaproteobacteria bacterium]